MRKMQSIHPHGQIVQRIYNIVEVQLMTYEMALPSRVLIFR